MVSEQEEALLLSPARPIVLLNLKKGRYGFASGVSGESRFLGAFLPYTGLHQMLTEAAGPLVMTSGNVTDEPILTSDEEMEELWKQQPMLLEGIAWNDRKIVTPLDDSLMRITGGRPQLLRRSRGFVPAPVALPGECPVPVLAMGGDLKACFCLAYRKRGYMSQYFGDMESYKVFRTFLQAAEHMEKLFGIIPGAVACDLHPGYATAGEAARLAEERNLPLFPFQHHHAHAASVMAEHGLRRCIAVVFDGTGYGTDGTVWEGNFCCVRAVPFSARGIWKKRSWLAAMLRQRMQDLPLSAISIMQDVSFRREKQRMTALRRSSERKWSVLRFPIILIRKKAAAWDGFLMR